MSRQDRLERVRGFRGMNYWPTYSRTPVDNWTSECRRDALSRELSFIEGLGLNAVRLWGSAWGWERDPAIYVDNLSFALDRCTELGLDVHLSLFDSCGIDPSLGDASERSLEDALSRRAPDDPILHLSRIWNDQRMDMYDSVPLVVVPDRGAGNVVIWETWEPNPGYAYLEASHWPRWEKYVQSVVEAVRDHPALALLEVMNEPFITDPSHDVARIRAFYARMHSVMRSLAPDVPLTMGAESVARFQDYESDLEAPLDVVSFHPLHFDMQAMRDHFARAEQLGAETGRPALGSEWGAFPGCHDEGQLSYYEQALPIVLESGCAWHITHLIVGYGPFALTALLYPNGTMRPAAKLVRQTLRSAS